MTKWLRKWRRGWLYVYVQTQKRKVSIINATTASEHWSNVHVSLSSIMQSCIINLKQTLSMISIGLELVTCYFHVFEAFKSTSALSRVLKRRRYTTCLKHTIWIKLTSFWLLVGFHVIIPPRKCEAWFPSKFKEITTPTRTRVAANLILKYTSEKPAYCKIETKNVRCFFNIWYLYQIWTWSLHYLCLTFYFIQIKTLYSVINFHLLLT